jgi:hypothetical protein
VYFLLHHEVHGCLPDNTIAMRSIILFDLTGFMTQTFRRFALFILLVTKEQGCRKGRDFGGDICFPNEPADDFVRAVSPWNASC